MLMRRLIGTLSVLVALTAAVMLYIAHPARSSDHQDAPAQLANPLSDITDVYLFPDTVHKNNVILAMDIDPLITPGSKTAAAALDPNLLYEFKISHSNTVLGNAAREDAVIQIQATGSGPSQSVSLYGPTKPDVTGAGSVLESSALVGNVAFNTLPAAKQSNGSYVFAGPRADPFFFDLFQFFKILPDRNYANKRTGDKLGYATPSFNGYAAGSKAGAKWGNYACSTAASQNALTQAAPPGFNVVTVMVSVPRAVLAPTSGSQLVHVWATVSQPHGTHMGQPLFLQEERLARPAVKELFEHFGAHEGSNHVAPYRDEYMRAAIPKFVAAVPHRSAAISGVLSAILIPDEMSADLTQSGPAAYLGVETGGATGGKFGGRGLTDNVVDISLEAVFGNVIPALKLAPDDGWENGCLISQHVTSGQGGAQTQAGFPFFANPH
jgi:uncharacterized protein DUF4331